MKKLLLMVSALSAGLFSVAHADITVSGSGGLGLASGQGAYSTAVGGAGITFGLSSDLGNGVTVSTKGTVSVDSDANDATLTDGISGFHTFTIATGGSTVNIGQDIDIAGDGVGELGSVGSDLNDLGGYGGGTVGAGLGEEDGFGLGFSTALGTATVTASYVLDTVSPTNSSASNLTTTASGIQASLPMGAMTIVAGMGQDDRTGTSGGTHTGLEASMAISGGTLSVGTFSTDLNSTGKDKRGYGAKFATTLGSASVSVGYRYRDNTTDNTNSTVTSASLSQSIGAGASVFVDAVNYSGYASASETGTNIAVGTTFSF